MDSLFLTQDVDAIPTDSIPESPESANLSEVRLSDPTVDGATVHATFAGYAEDVLPDGYDLEIEGVGIVSFLPHVVSDIADTAEPPAPVLTRQLDPDGETIHLSATLVTDNGTLYAPQARGVVSGAAATGWVDSTPVELVPSGTDSYKFERRVNGGDWALFATETAADPTTTDDTDEWFGLIEHRVAAQDTAGNAGDYSNVVSTQSGQVTTVTVTSIASDSFVVNVETAAGYNIIPAGESVEIRYGDGSTVTLTDVDTLPYTETSYADNVAPEAPTGSLFVAANIVNVTGIFGADYGRNVSVDARETIASVWQDYSPSVQVEMLPSGFGSMHLEYRYDSSPWNPDERVATTTPYEWTFTPPAAGVEMSFRATGTDEAGNTSGYSNVVSYSAAPEADVVMFAPVQLRPLN